MYPILQLLSKPEAYQPFTPTSAEMNELVTPHKLETLVEKGAYAASPTTTSITK